MKFLKPLLVSSVIASMSLFCSCNNANNKNADSKEKSDSTQTQNVEEVQEFVAENAEPSVAPSTTVNVVYMDVDTVLQKYVLAMELTSQLTKKQEKSASSLQAKQTKLQQDMAQYQQEVAQFQQDYQNGKFLTQASIQEVQQKMAKREQELMKQDKELQDLNAKLTKEMFDEQEKMNKRLRDSLDSVLKQYHKENRYKLILSNNGRDNVIWGDPSLNITQIVIGDLNSRYKKNK